MLHTVSVSNGFIPNINGVRCSIPARIIGDMDIFEAPIEEWEWPQVVWWLQTFENFGELARVFGEYQCGG